MIPIAADHEHAEAEARAVEKDTAASGAMVSGLGQALAEPRLQRASFWESVRRFFGGGTFSDEELFEYLRFLDINNAIEDRYDSDNKAREVVRRWSANDARYVLPVRRKILLIQEVLSGWVASDDEQAVLTLLRRSNDTEIGMMLSNVGEERLHRELGNEADAELEGILEPWRRRRAGERPAAAEEADEGAAGRRQKRIDRIVVDQETTQTVTVHYRDGGSESDICSTGKGQCCVDAATPGAAACTESESRRGGTSCTPVGVHTVQFKIPETGGGVRLWTEFVDSRDIALHEYTPVDGTPLSHGCVRLNRPMAQKIYEGAVPRRTKVEIRGLARPRCDYPMLQREWAGDFKTAGSTPPDGEPVAVRRRQERSIRRTRRTLTRRLGVSESELDATIERLRRETGGLPTDIWSSTETRERTLAAVAPVEAEIPRCAAPAEE
jgi:hypothetical protein